MVFDQHVLDSLLERLLGVLLPCGQLPVLVQVEGKLCQDPELTLDLDPAWGGHETPGVEPLLADLLIGGQGLQPEVEHLLIQAQADQGSGKNKPELYQQHWLHYLGN